ncbi:MAG: porin [Caldimonas sp.]
MKTFMGSLAPAFLIVVSAHGPLAGSARAQAVSLFGLVDIGIRQVHNGSAGRYRSQSSNGLNPDLLGFRGTEDLGGGVSAGFWLETGFLPDAGATFDPFWNRRATVSLVDRRLGELRIGLDTVPTFYGLYPYTPTGALGVGSVIGDGGTTSILSDLGSGVTTLRAANNVIGYFLPDTLGGVYGQASVSAGEGVVGTRYVGARIGYQNETLDLSVAHGQTPVALHDTFRQTVLGAACKLGPTRLTGLLVQARYASLSGGPRRQNLVSLGAEVQVGVGTAHASVVHGEMSGGAPGSGYSSADGAQQVAIGYIHNLSTRTALYSTAATLGNRGASKLVVDTGRSGMKSGERSTGVEAGIRHIF